VSQSRYTLDQVRASVKLIAGLAAHNLARPDFNQGQIKPGLVAVQTALGDIHTICADILQRGIVGEVAVPERKRGSK
jgi:hypothetical protein